VLRCSKCSHEFAMATPPQVSELRYHPKRTGDSDEVFNQRNVEVSRGQSFDQSGARFVTNETPRDAANRAEQSAENDCLRAGRSYAGTGQAAHDDPCDQSRWGSAARRLRQLVGDELADGERSKYRDGRA